MPLCGRESLKDVPHENDPESLWWGDSVSDSANLRKNLGAGDSCRGRLWDDCRDEGASWVDADIFCHTWAKQWGAANTCKTVQPIVIVAPHVLWRQKVWPLEGAVEKQFQYSLINCVCCVISVGWSSVFQPAFSAALPCENKSVNRSSACSVWHCLFWDSLQMWTPETQKQKEPSCSVKVARGWENKSDFLLSPPVLSCYGSAFRRRISRGKHVRKEGRKKNNLSVFDTAVTISWLWASVVSQPECPSVACLISEWLFFQLGLGWSLCLRVINVLQAKKKNKGVKSSNQKVNEDPIPATPYH